ncbi:MAG: hypothetical protein PHQ19_03500 [Candidatus Krumholzibacteria bacterium]|nr:hypothetical protein [Candidatus Krumholzibacteria bacterium]
MSRRSGMSAAAIMLAVAAGWTGCLVEDRQVEIVLNDEHCERFAEHHTAANYVTPGLLEFSDELDVLLADNGIDKEQIVDAFLVGGFFEVIEFSHPHDWEIEGIITVERTDIADDPDTLVVYTSVSVEDALGNRTRMTLHPRGVAAIDRALDDYLAGGYPALLLTVISGGVQPPPSPVDPLSFRWESCLAIQVIYTLETRIIDPLGG